MEVAHLRRGVGLEFSNVNEVLAKVIFFGDATTTCSRGASTPIVTFTFMLLYR